MKDKFLKKFDELFNVYKAEDQSFKAIKDDPIKSKRKEQDSLATLDKILLLFEKLVHELPKEYIDSVYGEFENSYIAMVGKRSYEGLLKNYIVPPRFPTPESRKYHLFYSTPQPLFHNGAVRVAIEQSIQHIDDKALEKIINEIDAFQSPITTNVKVEFFRERVEELKKQNVKSIKNKKRLNELNDELDSVAETVITSDTKYSSSQGEVYDAIYRQRSEKRIDELNDKALEKEEYKPYKEYFVVYDSGKYGGTRSITEAHIGDTNMANVFIDDKVKMVIPEKTQKSILKVLDYMRNKNMLRDGASLAEADHKIYGFAAIYEAHKRLEAAIETKNVEEIRSAKNQYKTEVESMRGLYKLIKEEFNPDVNMFVGNVNSYREQFVPNEFKNDLVINALVSGFFNLNAVLAQNNVSIDMLFKNPNKVSMDAIKGYAGRAMADSVFKGKSIAESIKIIIEGKTTGGYPGYGLGRCMEFLQAITYGTDAFEMNSFSTMLISSYAMYVGNLIHLGDALTTKDYLKEKEVETLANVLLVNEEDRDYNKLRAIDGIAIDGTSKIPAFDTMKYLTSNEIDAGKFINRIKTTIAQLHAEKHFQRNTNATKVTALADTIRAAQFAAYQFLMVHPVPDGSNISRKHFNTIKDIMTDPERVFKKQIDKDTEEALKTRVPKHHTIETNGKAKFDIARIDARAAEEAYANSVEAINTELKATLGSLVGADETKKGELNDKKVELENKLKELSKLEQARLDKAYTDGKLPKDYYEQRKRDVQSGEYLNEVPFGASEYPDLVSYEEKYKTELESGELSKDDVRNLYDRMMENARYEEKMFYFVATEAYPKPTLEAEEVAIVPLREPIVVDIVDDIDKGSVTEKIEASMTLVNTKDFKPKDK